MFNCINGAGLRVPERCHFPMKLGTFEQASQALICVMLEKSLILFSFVVF